jgi:hypothetical protein
MRALSRITCAVCLIAALIALMPSQAQAQIFYGPSYYYRAPSYYYRGPSYYYSGPSYGYVAPRYGYIPPSYRFSFGGVAYPYPRAYRSCYYNPGFYRYRIGPYSGAYFYRPPSYSYFYRLW